MDLSDGRLQDGTWKRFGEEPTLLPFGASVEEFQSAIEAELCKGELSGRGEAPAGGRQGEFIRQLREEEALRDRKRSSECKSAPVVAFFAGSLTGVTAPMWEVRDETGVLHEFTSEGDAKRFKREVLKKVRLKERYEEMIKEKVTTAAAVHNHRGGVPDARNGASSPPADNGNKPPHARPNTNPTSDDDTSAETGNEAPSKSSSVQPTTPEAKEPAGQESDAVDMAFDSFAAIAVGATRAKGKFREHLKERLRNIVDNGTFEVRADKQSLLSKVQDAVQVFAQTIEDEDGLMVRRVKHSFPATGRFSYTHIERHDVPGVRSCARSGRRVFRLL